MNDVQEPPDEHRGSTPTVTPDNLAGPRIETPAAADVAAFSAFYRTEIRALVNFLVWMGAGLADAANIAQDTMIEVYKQWPSVRNHRAWTRRVASRLYGRQRFTHEVATEQEVISPLLRASDDIADWEQRHDGLQLVATLPERQRQVMAWTLDGYTPQEIAEELGITADAVRASLMLARRTLAQRLGKEGGRE
jgi:RNA polymerase sigma-70 factor (ECF subfamily)